MKTIENLTDYLSKFGESLSQKIESRFNPLVRRNESLPFRFEPLRKPYPAQWDNIQATVQTWNSGQNASFLSGETGSGKSLVSACAVHMHAQGNPYRALVVCPTHLVQKWKREVGLTLPGVSAEIIDGYRDLVELSRVESYKPTYSRFYVMSDSKAKLGTGWEPAYMQKMVPCRDGGESTVEARIHCPCCGDLIEMKSGDDVVPATHADLAKKRMVCKSCGSPLFQWKHNFDRWPCADFISKRLRGWFQYYIHDECHQAQSPGSASGNSSAQLASAIKYKLAMTGTILNGYAECLFPMLYRFDSKRMVELDLDWGQSAKFSSRYGRLETVTVHKSIGTSNKISKGNQISKQTRVKPGIMPTIYGDCLMGNTTFLQLSDITQDLPKQETFLHGVEMDDEMFVYYREMEDALRSSLAQLLRSGNKKAMSLLLQTLLSWPDHPRGFGEIGYTDENGAWITVYDSPDLSEKIVRAKERKAVEVVVDAVSRGNQVWLYTIMTDKRDVQPRLQSLLADQGIDARILRSKEVKPVNREKWIADNCDAPCMIMHPQLVATGLDAFDAVNRSFNYNTLFFYSTGYVLNTCRQASGRARRIGQWKECELHFAYYSHTMQEQAARLMSSKTKAAEAIEGVFSEEGLSSLAGSDDNASMALVKALLGKGLIDG